MVLGRIADGVSRTVGGVTDAVTRPFSDTVIRLGVTGLSRAGKTVFITSLVANLMDRGRMPGLLAGASGRIASVYLQPQPDDTLPRFDFEAHLGRITGSEPRWPDGTRAISELRLSLRVQPSGMLSGLQGLRTVHLDIVDYPGEWLLDLGLMDKSFAEWSAQVLDRIAERPQAQAFRDALAAIDQTEPLEEPKAQQLAAAFTEYLNRARADGYSDCTPGRFLLPGDLAGSPVLTFAPLPAGNAPRNSLAREFERRFESYKRNVVTPFFRDHFSRIDRQVVLVDVLGALAAGPKALDDLRGAMADILKAFRPGRNAFLRTLFTGRRVERILFAATKADHLHHKQHPQLAAIVRAMLREAKDRADFAGAETRAMALASLRTTTEDSVSHAGAMIDVVRGRLPGGQSAAVHPGELPDDPGRLLSQARERAAEWEEGGYDDHAFDPAKLSLKPGEGPPHIRLDQAAQFLIGDQL